MFDDLDAVTVDELTGRWRGSEIPTGHPLGGLLERYGWWGKRFDGREAAHPLVFADARGTFSVDPAGAHPALLVRVPALLRAEPAGALGRRVLKLRRTSRPKGRLRMVEHRGVVTGTLVYDALPVQDHFRRVDDDTLLGLMDARAVAEPFLFVLRRAS